MTRSISSRMGARVSDDECRSQALVVHFPAGKSAHPEIDVDLPCPLVTSGRKMSALVNQGARATRMPTLKARAADVAAIDPL